MKKAVVILAEGFEEIEAITPADILRRAGVDVTLAGVSSLSVRGSHGIAITCDMLIAGIQEPPHALILPGGQPGADNLAASETLRQLILQTNDSGNIVAAICASPGVVLAPLGILNGRTATCFPGYEKKFPPAVTYSPAPLAVDKNIITSRGPGTAFIFALAIAEKLAGTSKAEGLANKMQYTVK